MKNSTNCIKCQGEEILKIRGKRMPHGGGNYIDTDEAFYSVKVTRYLCVSCGYSEEWVDNQMDRNKLKEKYGTDK